MKFQFMEMKWQRVIWVVLLGIDQITKYIFSDESRLVLNSNSSFGWQVSLIYIVCLFGLWLFYQRRLLTTRSQQLSSMLLIVGAGSNLIDRLVVGSVRDWMKIPLFSIYNNLADYYIVIGAGWLIISLMLQNKNEK